VFCYSNDGSSMRAVDPDYTAQGGEVLFPDYATDAQLAAAFSGWTAPPPPRPTVLKSVVQSRIIDAGKMGDAYAALTANPVYFARWFAPDHPVVYSDDPDAVGLVTALGLDPAVILAP
jgi:hypothetical protein